MPGGAGKRDGVRARQQSGRRQMGLKLGSAIHDLCNLWPVDGASPTAALSASGVGAQWRQWMGEHLSSWGGWHPHKGGGGWQGMLTISLEGLVAEGSEFLEQGPQGDAHGIVPALPDIQQQPVVSCDRQDVHEV